MEYGINKWNAWNKGQIFFANPIAWKRQFQNLQTMQWKQKEPIDQSIHKNKQNLTTKKLAIADSTILMLQMNSNKGNLDKA